MMNEPKIRNLCDASGLAVARLHVAQDVLVVTPDSLDDLPDAEVLAELGEALREASSCRYVTLALDQLAVDESATDDTVADR